MQELLTSAEGAEILDRLVRERLLCAFDFDGTLAPLVARPDDARLPAEMREALLSLQHRAPVAIITGRGLQDIRSRLGFEPDFVIGNHGMEGVPGAKAHAAAERHAAICADWKRQLDTLLAAEYPDPGIQIEDKHLSLSVHYRHAEAAERAQSDLAPLLATLDPPPRIVGGKWVFNLMPPGAHDKGTALAALMEESGARGAVYVGDDVTDEDVFRLRRDDLLSVRVEPSPTSAAAFFVPALDAMPKLLETLSRRLAKRDAQNWLRA